MIVICDLSPVSIQTQSLRKRKPQETQALALASSQSWLPLLRLSIPIGWRLHLLREIFPNPNPNSSEKLRNFSLHFTLWNICTSIFYHKRVSLKHDGTDGTVKMANLPVPSVCDRRDRLSRLCVTDRTVKMAN